MTNIPQMEPWYDEAEEAAVAEYMKSGAWLTDHVKTAEFERALADFVGVRHCIVVPNGTLALVAALWTLGVRAGDEVIVPDLTMIATANAAVLLGAKPVLVDVEPVGLGLDPQSVAAALTPKTKAVIFVSFNGRPGRILEVAALCQAHGIPLLEDAAQALGSYCGSQHLGTIGLVGTFSFSVHKIISTGQGGAVVTSDDELGESLRRIKDFGRSRGGIDIHDTIGFNFKFTDLQAVVGFEQLKKVPLRMRIKRNLYRRYSEGLNNVPSVELIETNVDETTPWFIEILVLDPDGLALHLAKQGIGTRRMYPPIHSQKAFRWPGEYPVSEDISSRGLWLPSGMQLEETDIDRICFEIKRYYEGSEIVKLGMNQRRGRGPVSERENLEYRI